MGTLQVNGDLKVQNSISEQGELLSTKYATKQCATTSANGLMSSTDKQKLDYWYGVTPASDANQALSTGFYSCQTNTPSQPSGNNPWWYIETIQHADGAFSIQHAYHLESGSTARRIYNGERFSQWEVNASTTEESISTVNRACSFISKSYSNPQGDTNSWLCIYYPIAVNSGYITAICQEGVNKGSICHNTKQNGTLGEWEWENPPLEYEKEYRTTEKLCHIINNKQVYSPIYVKRLSPEKLPYDHQNYDIDITDLNMAHFPLKEVVNCYDSGGLSFRNRLTVGYWSSNGLKYIGITPAAGTAQWNIDLTFWYTKPQ